MFENYFFFKNIKNEFSNNIFKLFFIIFICFLRIVLKIIIETCKMIKNKTLKIIFRFSNSLLFYKILENRFQKTVLKNFL